MSFLTRYTKWLHTRWPAGLVEKLPVTRDDGGTNVPGLFVVGDLRGIPLLKFSADTGARAVQSIVADAAFQSARTGAAASEGRAATSSPSEGRAGASAAPSSSATREAPLDLVIVGAGVSGMAAALEARKLGVTFRIFESSEAFSTIVNFPKGKPIFTYPKEMTPAGDLTITAQVKEPLVAELRAQTLDRGISPEKARVERVKRDGNLFEVSLADQKPPVFARRVIVALGRSGNYRKLGVPGETLDKVSNRLHDPQEFAGQNVLVVGGGDSALEAAIALAERGAAVTVSYRKSEFSRPKPENSEKLQSLVQGGETAAPSRGGAGTSATAAPARGGTGASAAAAPARGGTGASAAAPHAVPGRILPLFSSQVTAIGEKTVSLKLADGSAPTVPNDSVFLMIGREAPLDFFRRSGVAIHGEWTPMRLASLALFFLLCVFIYHWKAGGHLTSTFQERGLFPFMFGASDQPQTLGGTLAISMGGPGFWYSLAYCLCVAGFGFRRMVRRPTPYVRLQTWTLIAIQWIPLFLVPYVLLPWAGHLGAFDAGLGKTFADTFFPAVNYEHGREYWRAFGFVLAWPLFLWNVFTDRPMMAWLVVGILQTFVLIPLLIRRWGKGAYCGWICSCGALAETLGDDHRTKMPHGPVWNRLNMTGQVILGVAALLLLLRVVGWMLPHDHAVNAVFAAVLQGKQTSGAALAFPWNFVNYKWIVDLFLAGIVGVGLYFHFSGRVWCRFACPLAALMHIYARFSKFAIVAEKKKCISCNVCTSVCHQGIDIMNFANKGLPMIDPECVRCSACVQSCPTGVLQFGQVTPAGTTISVDRLAASPVRLREGV